MPTEDQARRTTFSARRGDFRLDWFSGSGAGGQHRNKHQNCLRLTHIPTGMMETCQEHRERGANLKTAFRRLAKRLIDHHVRQEQRARYLSTERVRTYHEPDQRVTDHATGERRGYDDVVHGRGLGELIEARRQRKLEEKNDG